MGIRIARTCERPRECFDSLVIGSILLHISDSTLGQHTESANVVITWPDPSRTNIYVRSPNSRVLIVFANIDVFQGKVIFKTPDTGNDVRAMLEARKVWKGPQDKRIVWYDLNQESEFRAALDHITDFVERLIENADEENKHPVA